MSGRRERQIATRIARALDPLRARLRRGSVGALAARIARIAADAGWPDEPAPMTLALALVDEAERAGRACAERRRALDELADAVATHGPAAAAAGTGGRDLEAFVEREARTLAELDGTRAVCLAAAGRLAAEAWIGAVAAPPGRTEPVVRRQPGWWSRLQPEGTLPERLLEQGADPHAPWPVRTAALEALARVLGALPYAPPARLVGQIDLLLGDERSGRWVKIAAAHALAACDPARARARARERLATPRAADDDFIVRAGLVRLLGGPLADAASCALLLEAAEDPSEHVRQWVARAVAPSRDPLAKQALARLADAAAEPSPRVRAVAAQMLTQRACAPLEDADAAAVLWRLLAEDPDELPRAAAAAAIADACTQADLAPDMRATLVAALDVARTARELLPGLANELARAAERARADLHPGPAALHHAIAAGVAGLAEKARARVALPPETSADDIGRSLARLAQSDLGLYAWRDGDALVVQRGEVVKHRAWRVLHELLHPLATKRQGYSHTIGRASDAPLRAPPTGMAEVTRTRVPGERVLVSAEGGWAPYLPLVDDLLDALGGGTLRLYSEHGCTTVAPPAGVGARLHARAQLTSGYAELADLRLRSLEAGDPSGRAAYLAAATGLGFDVGFHGYDGVAPPQHVRTLFARRRPLHLAGDSRQPIGSALALAPLATLSGLHDVGTVLGDPHGGVAELAVFAAAAIAMLAGRSLSIRADVHACRRSVPLVVGGWGTRGKSGVERLKAALFHALGYEVVAKTTGCEATVLVGVPGRPLTEVPLYRPYEKATIWEQRDVLRLAGVRKPHVLLWECMALNPDYVDLLQRGWMRDDVSTLTNAYPDHEDVQGPSGLDVARVIAGFTPRRGRLVTAEEQMLPVIRDRARREGTALTALPARAHELISPELIARFPYQEHPRNIALVMALAEELGIDPEIAVVEMAEHVLPDIGGLASYGPLPTLGRRLRFTNGMSANERASALGNWTRVGLDRHRVDEEPGRWIVALVNNRADRAARTLTFAEAIALDFAAHRFVLVGSNTAGLRRAVEEAVDRRLTRLRPTEVPALLEQLKIGAANVGAVLAEVDAWLAGLGADAGIDRKPGLLAALVQALNSQGLEEPATAEQAVDASGAPVRLAEALGGLELGAAEADEVVRCARASCVRRRLGAGLRRDPGNERVAAVLRPLFLDRIVEIADAEDDPDRVLAAVAAACPPGSFVEVMGLMNIKGPGLALVHRFAAAQRALADCALAAGPGGDAARARLEGLTGVGALVLGTVAAELELGAAGAAQPGRLRELARRLRSRAALEDVGRAGAGPRGLGRLASALRRTVDHLSSASRRRRADRLFADLARGRIATTQAAVRAARLIEEQRS
jgi:poly-gamma-glutamate synthase PgsB/CapB